MTILDCHTHNPNSLNAIYNLSVGNTPYKEGYYSIGVHPWEADINQNISINDLIFCASSENVVAIGETGIDTIKGGDIDTQKSLFIKHIEVSETLKKPVMLHVVKAWQQIIEIRRLIKPSQIWIAHGFRGKPQLAKELLKHGICISLGEHFNIETATTIPDEMLLTESDESNLSIYAIINKIAEARAISPDNLRDIIVQNTDRIFLKK